MKRTILSLLIIWLISSCGVIPRGNFKAWKKCLENSEYSDSDCEECDRKYNPKRNFYLSDRFKNQKNEEV